MRGEGSREKQLQGFCSYTQRRDRQRDRQRDKMFTANECFHSHPIRQLSMCLCISKHTHTGTCDNFGNSFVDCLSTAVTDSAHFHLAAVGGPLY